jgi:hypothetical protein
MLCHTSGDPNEGANSVLLPLPKDPKAMDQWISMIKRTSYDKISSKYHQISSTMTIFIASTLQVLDERTMN